MTITKSAAKGAVRIRPYFTKKVGLLAIPAVVVTVAGVPLGAQGLNGTLTLGQGLRYEDRTDDTNNDDGFSSETELGLQLSSETRTQKLDLSINGALVYNFDSDDDKSELRNPTAQLSYALENKSTRLTFSARYTEAELDEVAFLADPLDIDSEIISGAGDRIRTAFNTELELGRGSPLRAELTHSYSETRYSGVTDPSLVDVTTQAVGGRLSYDLSRVMTLSAFANIRERDAAGPGSSDRDSTRFGLGLEYQISPVLRATVDLAHAEIDTDDNAGTTTSRDGLEFDFNLARDMPNGSLTFSFSEDETVNGKRRQIRLGRALDYSRGALDFTVGVTKTDGFDVETLLSAQASYELDPLSQLNLTLSQTSDVNDDNEESVNTRLSLGYSRTLSELSSLSAQLSVADRNALTVAGEDQTSTRLSLTHRYSLAEDLSLVSSYRYSKTQTDGSADRKSTVLFLGLEKTFDFRP